MEQVIIHMPPAQAQALREAHAAAGFLRPDGSIDMPGFVVLSSRVFDLMVHAINPDDQNSVAGQQRQRRGGDNSPLRPDAAEPAEHDPDT